MNSWFDDWSVWIVCVTAAALFFIVVAFLRRRQSQQQPQQSATSKVGKTGNTNIINQHPVSVQSNSSSSRWLSWFGVGSRGGVKVAGSPGGDGVLRWLDVAVGWAAERRRLVPDGWVEAWLRELNDQARRQSLTSTDDVTLRFDGLRSESETASGRPMTSSEISNVSAEVISSSILLLRCDLKLCELLLQASLVQKRPDGLCTVSCDVDVTSLSGQLHVQCEDSGNDVTAKVSFSVEPEIDLRCRLRNEHTIISINNSTLESAVRRAISRSVTTLRLKQQQQQQQQLAQETFITATRCDTVQQLGRPISPPAKPRRLLLDNSSPAEMAPPSNNHKRLLVKVVKANGLEESADGCEPYCILGLDEPPQTYTTSPVKNTGNPFFDESFLFDVDSTSRRISFEVHDRKRARGSDFLGRTDLVLNGFGHVMAGRQILPLSAAAGGAMAFGSLTVELAEVDASYILQSSGVFPGSKQSAQQTRPTAAAADNGLPAASSLHRVAQHTSMSEGDLPTASDISSQTLAIATEVRQKAVPVASTLPPTGGSFAVRTIKRRSLGSVIRSRLSRALSGRSLSADRAARDPPPVDVRPPTSLTPPPIGSQTYRTSVELQISADGSQQQIAADSSTNVMAGSHRSRSSSTAAFRRMFHRRDKSRDSSSGSRPRSATAARSRESSTTPSPQL